MSRRSRRCKPQRNERAIPVAVNNGEAPENWAEQDAQWFRNNPDETRRVRPAIPGELVFAWTDHTTLIEVTQIEPGVRLRRVIAHGGAA